MDLDASTPGCNISLECVNLGKGGVYLMLIGDGGNGWVQDGRKVELDRGGHNSIQVRWLRENQARFNNRGEGRYRRVVQRWLM
jgi:hypothetical protein